MRKFLVEAWHVLVERMKIHKALRIMNKQEWSIEFLTALLIRAAHTSNQQLEMAIIGPNGYQFLIRTADSNQSQTFPDDDVFNHLDDENWIRHFTEQVNKGRS